MTFQSKTLQRSLLALTGLLIADTAGAAVVLTIDVTNPAAVVITARPGNSEGESTATLLADGVTLINLFTSHSPTNYGPLFSSNLVGAGGLSPYDARTLISFSGNSSNQRDLNIYSTAEGSSATQNFQIGATAFTGSATADFSTLNLAAVGSTGNIVTGWTSDFSTHGVVIGQWEIVPEPSLAALAGIGALSLLRRRRVLG